MAQLTRDELAAELGCEPDLVDQLVSEGLPYSGGAFDQAAVQAWLSEHALDLLPEHWLAVALAKGGR